MRVVEVVEYDPSWPAQFEAERTLLHQTLGEAATAIHHIGSTSVPGLAAKPVIDILIEVADLKALDALNDRMIRSGYTPRGEWGIPGRRYFQKGGDRRTHHLHAFASGDFGLVRHLAFRDYLRSNPETAREYGDLKKSVAKTCLNDLGRYCDGKDAYVKRIEAVAIEEIRPNKPVQRTGAGARR